MNKNLTLLSALLLSLATTVTSYARGINWSSAVGDNFLMANGVTPMDDSFSFQLGGFNSGFTPTQANLSLWESNWLVFDSAVTGDGWNSAAGAYTSSASTVAFAAGLVNSSDTGQIFAIGQQAYLWTYNSKSVTTGTEWSLISNSTWTYPAADALAIPLDWTLADPGNTATFGATSYDGGTFISTLQAQAVPEPGSALLIAVAGVLIRLRRRFGR